MWHDFNFHELQNGPYVRKQQPWYNTHIKINGKDLRADAKRIPSLTTIG